MDTRNRPLLGTVYHTLDFQIQLLKPLPMIPPFQFLLTKMVSFKAPEAYITCLLELTGVCQADGEPSQHFPHRA